MVNKVLTLIFGLVLPLSSFADYILQANSSNGSFYQQLELHLNTNHPYDELNENIYVLDFSSGQIAKFHVSQTNPWEPYRVITEVPTSQSVKNAALTISDLYFQAKTSGGDLPQVPAHVVPTAYQLATTSAYRNDLTDYLVSSGLINTWREKMELTITFAETAIASVREVEMIREVELADKGKVVIKLIKNHHKDFRYFILEIHDSHNNFIPIEGRFNQGGSFDLRVAGDETTFNYLTRFLQGSGFVIVNMPSGGAGAVGKVTVIECTANECKIVSQ